MLKFATCTTSVRHAGTIVRIQIGDAWHADDPFVRSHPQMFADMPHTVYGRPSRQVEAASAAPGEKRATRRSAE